MMIDQEQTTQTSETESLDTTTSETKDMGSSTSTTDQPEKVDLAETGDDTTVETKTEERTPEQIAADEAKAELFGAPAEGEDYAVEGLPEGMEIDKEALDAFTPVARVLGLSNKGLSKIAGVYAEKVLPGVMARATQNIEQQVIAKRAEWEGEALAAVQSNGSELKNKAGEVLSFDAKALPAVRAIAAKALDRLAPEGFREFLAESGLSVHPFMVAFSYQAGKNLAEDTSIEATDTGTGKRTSSVAPAKSGGMHTEKFFDRG